MVTKRIGFSQEELPCDAAERCLAPRVATRLARCISGSRLILRFLRSSCAAISFLALSDPRSHAPTLLTALVWAISGSNFEKCALSRPCDLLPPVSPATFFVCLLSSQAIALQQDLSPIFVAIPSLSATRTCQAQCNSMPAWHVDCSYRQDLDVAEQRFAVERHREQLRDRFVRDCENEATKALTRDDLCVQLWLLVGAGLQYQEECHKGLRCTASRTTRAGNTSPNNTTAGVRLNDFGDRNMRRTTPIRLAGSPFKVRMMLESIESGMFASGDAQGSDAMQDYARLQQEIARFSLFQSS